MIRRFVCLPWRTPLVAWATITLGFTGLLLAVTLPDLGRYPRVHADEIWVMSAAYKLATTGVFGSDMFAGFAGADRHYFIALPVHHLLEALTFTLFGTGIEQARLVSVVAAIVVLWASTWLAFRWHGLLASALTGALLLALRVNLVDLWPGLPLVSVGRSARYDMTAVAFFWLAIVFLDLTIERSPGHRSWPAYAAGVCAGLATLTQFFGAFSVAVIAVTLLWRTLARLPVRGIAIRIGTGWISVVLPYVAYVAAHWADFRGQAALKEGRTDFLSPRFYLDNLRDEPARYQHLIQPDRITGNGAATWLFVLTILPTLCWLMSRATRSGRAGDRLLLTTLLVGAVSLALTDSTNVPLYTIVLWPGCCIALGMAIAAMLTWGRGGATVQRPTIRRAPFVIASVGAAIVALAILIDGIDAFRDDHALAQTVTSYEEVASQLDTSIPAGAGVVGHERWWLGLRDHPYLALTTLQLEWERRQRGPDSPTFAELFVETGASALIVDDNARSEITRYPEALREQIAAFLARDVAQEIVVTDPTYGRFEIYLLAERRAAGEVARPIRRR